MSLIFECGGEGRRGFMLPPLDVPAVPVGDIVGEGALRQVPPGLPQTAEIEVVRHFTELSRLNFGVDSGFYPLGSCTMKYNPKVHEVVASMQGFADLHPLADEADAQGSLRVMAELEKQLCEICGMHSFTLQPAAGAHGELTGLMLMAAYFDACGQRERSVMLIPDSAHGTNPASAALAGFTVLQVPSGADGLVDLEALAGAILQTGGRLAGLMLTNPNTLGLFETGIERMAEMVHAGGGLLYYDGANLNAVMGKSSPGRMGFDVVHVNLHKTFSTPHGGGGPGSGPVGVCEKLVPFLPVPRVVEQDGVYRLSVDAPQSIGRVRSFYGNFGVYLRAYAYILSLGGEGLTAVSEMAVLCANYVRHGLGEVYDVPYDRPCMHEFVASAQTLKEQRGVSAMDVAKGLIDRGFHPPTVYFPLIVKEALMIEPTETETRQTLDAFVAAMLEVARADAEELHAAPQTAPIDRPDDTRAARQPILRA